MTGEVAQKLKVLITVLEEDLRSGSRTHMVAHSYLYLQFQGTQHPCLASVGTRHVHSAHTFMQADIEKKVTLEKNYIFSAGTRMGDWRHVYPWNPFPACLT